MRDQPPSEPLSVIAKRHTLRCLREEEAWAVAEVTDAAMRLGLARRQRSDCERQLQTMLAGRQLQHSMCPDCLGRHPVGSDTPR